MAENSSDPPSDLAIEKAQEPRRSDAGFAPTLPAPTPHPALAPTLQGPATPLPKGDSSGGAVPVQSDLALVSVPGTIPGPLQDWERYEVVRPLGQGGMGTVFLARDKRLGRLVALKFLRLPSPDAADRMLQEARAQARLDHPGICKVYEVGEFQGQPYIAMEYVDGQPLHTGLRKLTLEQKVLLVQQIALAVHAAHSHGILHRDLKPANVMVCAPQADSSGEGQGGLRPVLMDFGLARDSLGPQRLTQTGVIMGTPHYMAPEQARGQARHLDRRADVYSLGAILYEMLTGRPPFDAEHEVDLLLAVLHQDPPPPRQLEPSVPIDLEVIALKCLRKEPEHRYDSALALAEDLQRYLRSEPILARPASTLYRIRRLAMRHRALFAVLVMALLALCGVAGITYRAKQKERQAAVRADERQRLAAELGQTITRLGLFLRVAYSLPPHSLYREQGLVREHLKRLEQERASADPFLHGTLERAIGQGYLVLGEYAPAVDHLKRALELGERAEDVHLTLGQSLGRLYEQRAAEINRSRDPVQAKAELTQLRRELLVPARKELTLGQGSEILSSAYVRALLHFYSEDPEAEYDAALTDARKSQLEAPWLIEPIELELKITMQRYITNIMHDKSPTPAEFTAVHDTIERAIDIARSYPDFYASFSDYAAFRTKNMLLTHGPMKDMNSVMGESVAHARVGLVLQPDSAAARDQLADVYAMWAYAQASRHQDSTEAQKLGLAASEEALRIQPSRGRTYMALARLHLAEMIRHEQLGEDFLEIGERGLADARRAAQLEPKSSDILNLLGVNLSMLVEFKRKLGTATDQETAELLDAGKRAMELRPDIPLPTNNLASIYMEFAEDLIKHGRDATNELAQAKTLVQKLQSQYPNYLLGLVASLALERIEIDALLKRGQDVTAQTQAQLLRAQQRLKPHADYYYLQAEVALTYFMLLDSLLQHPGAVSPGAVFDEAMAAIDEFAHQGMGPAQLLNFRSELLVRKAEWLKAQRQSPEPALNMLFQGLDAPDANKVAQPSELAAKRAQGLRIRADWLASERKAAPALAAVEAGLAVCAQSAGTTKGLTMGNVISLEQGALLTIKAQLARNPEERTQLANQAVSILSESLKKRPPLVVIYGAYLKTAQGLSKVAEPQ